MEPNTNTKQLRLDNRPGNVQRTSRLLSALLMLAVLPLWPTLSFAGVEAVLTDDAYTSSFSSEGQAREEERPSSFRIAEKLSEVQPLYATVRHCRRRSWKATLKVFVSKRRKAGSFDVFAVTVLGLSGASPEAPPQCSPTMPKQGHR